MKKPKMRLFVWEGCFSDYTDGLGVVLAENVEQARQLLREAAGYDADDIQREPDVYDLDKPVAFMVHGGG